ncbi:hypothetical protein NKG94_52130 [Micromonospora sp. M12]
MFYLAAAVGTLVSVDTSWRYFGERLHITNEIERGVLFGVLELALIACGVSMRAAARRAGEDPRRRAAGRLGAVRLRRVHGVLPLRPGCRTDPVVLGPVLALVCLHLALGIDLHVRRGGSAGTPWARVFGELRERAMSRLGLADDDRTAITRTRDRAIDRAARLATSSGDWLARPGWRGQYGPPVP